MKINQMQHIFFPFGYFSICSVVVTVQRHMNRTGYLLGQVVLTTNRKINKSVSIYFSTEFNEIFSRIYTVCVRNRLLIMH